MKWNSSWLMILCIVGMGAFFVLPALGLSFSGLLGFGLILLCPLSHFLMMRGMHSGQESRHRGPGNVVESATGNEHVISKKEAPRALPIEQPVATVMDGSSGVVHAGQGEG